MSAFTRRTILTGAALTAGAALAPARAGAPQATVQAPSAYRYKLGSYQLTAVYDGIWYLPIDGKLVRNASGDAVNAALAAAFLAPNVLPISFTALLVNTGKQLILIDTGTAGQIVDTAGSMVANLAAAGVTPDQIDTILISHFHPDHINGLRTKDGDKVFRNAEILVPEPEWAFWMDNGQQARAEGTVLRYFRNARRIFNGLEVGRFAPGAEVAPDIVSIAAYGHTPGHTAFAIHSGGQSMLAMSDTVRNPYLFARHPDWQPLFDMDGAAAVSARRRMLDQAAADRMLVEAYHFPFPACGHIARTATGYELVPVEWAPL